jgi:membrane dipeptidase
MKPIIPVFDGHNDTLTKYFDIDPAGETFLSGNASCRLDLPRAKQGGFAGGLFAVFTDPPKGLDERDITWGSKQTAEGYVSPLRSTVDQAYAASFSDRVIDYLRGLESKSAGQMKVATSIEELEQAWSAGVLAVILHFEGAEAIREDLFNLSSYYEKGLRSIGITWSRPNVFGCGVPFGCPLSPDQGPRLSQAGSELVRACNAMGILVDLAHLNAKGFSDVERFSNKPLVASHSNAHAICPCSRNLTDWQIDAIKASDGIIGANFEPAFLRPDGKSGALATLDMLADHIDYLVKRGGIDHVGLGSDFDGADVPEGLEDAAALPNIWEVLERRGYGHEDLEKIANGNWRRVLKATLKV